MEAVDDNSPLISYFPFADSFSTPNLISGWNPYYSKSGFVQFQGQEGLGDSFHITSLDNASFAVSWFGTGIDLVGNVTGNASYTINLDGSFVQQNSSSILLSSQQNLPSTNHTISLSVSNPSNDSSSFLAFGKAILTFPSPPNSTIQSLPLNSIAFSGKWSWDNDTSTHVSTTVGDSAHAFFSGTSLSISGAISPSGGQFSVSLANSSTLTTTLSARSSFTVQHTTLFFAAGFEPSKPHDVLVTNVDGGALVLDASAFNVMAVDSPVPTQPPTHHAATSSSRRGTIAAIVLAAVLAVILLIALLLYLYLRRRRRSRAHSRISEHVPANGRTDTRTRYSASPRFTFTSPRIPFTASASKRTSAVSTTVFAPIPEQGVDNDKGYGRGPGLESDLESDFATPIGRKPDPKRDAIIDIRRHFTIPDTYGGITPPGSPDLDENEEKETMSMHDVETTYAAPTAAAANSSKANTGVRAKRVPLTSLLFPTISPLSPRFRSRSASRSGSSSRSAPSTARSSVATNGHTHGHGRVGSRRLLLGGDDVDTDADVGGVMGDDKRYISEGKQSQSHEMREVGPLALPTLTSASPIAITPHTLVLPQAMIQTPAPSQATATTVSGTASANTTSPPPRPRPRVSFGPRAAPRRSTSLSMNFGTSGGGNTPAMMMSTFPAPVLATPREDAEEREVAPSVTAEINPPATVTAPAPRSPPPLIIPPPIPRESHSKPKRDRKDKERDRSSRPRLEISLSSPFSVDFGAFGFRRPSGPGSAPPTPSVPSPPVVEQNQNTKRVSGASVHFRLALRPRSRSRSHSTSASTSSTSPGTGPERVPVPILVPASPYQHTASSSFSPQQPPPSLVTTASLSPTPSSETGTSSEVVVSPGSAFRPEKGKNKDTEKGKGRRRERRKGSSRDVYSFLDFSTPAPSLASHSGSEGLSLSHSGSDSVKHSASASESAEGGPVERQRPGSALISAVGPGSDVQIPMVNVEPALGSSPGVDVKGTFPFVHPPPQLGLEIEYPPHTYTPASVPSPAVAPAPVGTHTSPSLRLSTTPSFPSPPRLQPQSHIHPFAPVQSHLHLTPSGASPTDSVPMSVSDVHFRAHGSDSDSRSLSFYSHSRPHSQTVYLDEQGRGQGNERRISTGSHLPPHPPLPISFAAGLESGSTVFHPGSGPRFSSNLVGPRLGSGVGSGSRTASPRVLEFGADEGRDRDRDTPYIVQRVLGMPVSSPVPRG